MAMVRTCTNCPARWYGFETSSGTWPWMVKSLTWLWMLTLNVEMGMGQNLLYHILGGWTSINPTYVAVHQATGFWLIARSEKPMAQENEGFFTSNCSRLNGDQTQTISRLGMCCAAHTNRVLIFSYHVISLHNILYVISYTIMLYHTMLYIKKNIVWYFTILSGEILNQIYNEINYEVKYHTMIVIFNGTINMIANTFDIILDLNWNILSSIDLNSISNRTLGYIGYLADKLYRVSSLSSNTVWNSTNAPVFHEISFYSYWIYWMFSVYILCQYYA